MKVEWLDDGLREALITRGFLWWRRCARVCDDRGDWLYVPSGDYVGTSLSVEMRERQAREHERREMHRLKQLRRRNELPARALPPARIIRGKPD